MILVAEAMWCWLRRLCVGLIENKANSACKLCFCYAGAELGKRDSFKVNFL